MTATSAHATFAPILGVFDIPPPKFPVGTKVDLSRVAQYNRSAYIKRVRDSIIRRSRKAIDEMHAEGYLPEMKGKKLLGWQKDKLREVFDFIVTADSVVIAGHAPWELHSLGNIANQCFLKGGAGFGAMNYGYYLMFRKNKDGRELVYTFPDPVMDESAVAHCVVQSA